MKIRLKRDEDYIEVGTITILIGTKQFRISETKFQELCVNKYDDDDSGISVIPRTSNEILIK